MEERLDRPAGAVWQAWLIHSFTALGVVFGLAALMAVMDDHPTSAVRWLLLSLVIDALDGSLARSYRVAEVLPKIDGSVLDVAVDFVNCVMVPMAFLLKFGMLPGGLAVPVAGFAAFTSALWFARTDMMSEDRWFHGFPTEWNIVVPTLFLLNGFPIVNAVLVVVLAALQLTSVKFVHPVRVVELRALTIVLTLTWLLTIVFLVPDVGQLPVWGPALLLVGPIYHAGLTVWRNVAPAAREAPAARWAG